MFEHYLPNKNEDATVAPKSKFRELNEGKYHNRVVCYLVSEDRHLLVQTPSIRVKIVRKIMIQMLVLHSRNFMFSYRPGLVGEFFWEMIL